MTFDEARLEIDLKAMEPLCRAAFALTVAERLLPAYPLRPGADPAGVATLETALRASWAAVLSFRTLANVDALLKAVEPLLAIPEQGWTYMSGLAEMSVLAVLYALRASNTGDVQDSLWASANQTRSSLADEAVA